VKRMGKREEKRGGEKKEKNKNLLKEYLFY
jgi:hypothetical protein